MFYLKEQQPSGAKLIGLQDWKLFFLGKEGLERFLFEAHQRELLEYYGLAYRSPEEFEGENGIPAAVETTTSATLVFFRS